MGQIAGSWLWSFNLEALDQLLETFGLHNYYIMGGILIVFSNLSRFLEVYTSVIH